MTCWGINIFLRGGRLSNRQKILPVEQASNPFRNQLVTAVTTIYHYISGYILPGRLELLPPPPDIQVPAWFFLELWRWIWDFKSCAHSVWAELVWQVLTVRDQPAKVLNWCSSTKDNREKGTWLSCAFPDIPSSQGRDPEKARAAMQWEKAARVSRECSWSEC